MSAQDRDQARDWSLDELHRAAERLSGQVMTTPLLGQPLLPGRSTSPGLRLKLEVLQQGGSLWFRGAMHSLARQLGAVPRLAVAGAPRRVLAIVTAAQVQRIPCLVRLHQPVPDRVLGWFAGFPGVDLAVVSPEDAVAACAEAVRAGAAAAPQPGQRDFDLGIATLGVELDRQMASDVELLLVAPGFAAAPLARAMTLLGRGCRVERVDGWDADDAATWRDALAQGARVLVDAPSAAVAARAFALAAEGQSVVAVLGV